MQEQHSDDRLVLKGGRGRGFSCREMFWKLRHKILHLPSVNNGALAALAIPRLRGFLALRVHGLVLPDKDTCLAPTLAPTLGTTCWV